MTVATSPCGAGTTNTPSLSPLQRKLRQHCQLVPEGPELITAPRAAGRPRWIPCSPAVARRFVRGLQSPAAIELPPAIDGTVPSSVSASTNPSASNEALARLRQQLAAGRALSPKYAALADFVLREPDRVAFMTAVELARAAAVSEATVIRFAVSLSFSGYPEFQREFQRVLQAELTMVRRLQHALGADDADPEGTIAGRELANIGATFDALDPADVRAVAQLLLAAPALRVVGLRASVCLADYVAYQLAQILPDVRPVTSGGSDAIEQLLAAPAAVVVAFAFPRYPRETVELVRAARDAGRTVVAITDGFGSPTATVPSGCCWRPSRHRRSSICTPLRWRLPPRSCTS